MFVNRTLQGEVIPANNAEPFRGRFESRGPGYRETTEIYLKPAADYVRPGASVTYATLVESARRYGQVAIGYRIKAEAGDATQTYGVHVNPRKSTEVTLTVDDKVIVLAQE